MSSAIEVIVIRACSVIYFISTTSLTISEFGLQLGSGSLGYVVELNFEFVISSDRGSHTYLQET
jgi:hypothetical protein